jgi:hypothetical protein
MSAPILGSDWQAALRALEPGWDSYDAKPITAAAIATVKAFALVPQSDGGIQVEIHRDQFDIEIEITAEGKIHSALVCADRLNK